MRRKMRRPGRTRPTIKPVLKTYRRGGMGNGRKNLVHRGEIIIKSPFGN